MLSSLSSSSSSISSLVNHEESQNSTNSDFSTGANGQNGQNLSKEEIRMSEIIKLTQYLMVQELGMIEEKLKDDDPIASSKRDPGTIYFTKDYRSRSRVLVIFPYREAGIWSRSIIFNSLHSTNENNNKNMHQNNGTQAEPNQTMGSLHYRKTERANYRYHPGSMLSYLRKAVAEGYGVLIMNPAAQASHPESHVLSVWNTYIRDPILARKAAEESSGRQRSQEHMTDIFILAFSRGAQLVTTLLNDDGGNGRGRNDISLWSRWSLPLSKSWV
jgi:hypothetical protein